MKKIETSIPELRLPRIGLGCRTMADDINQAPESIQESLATIRSATNHGVNYLNTADFYNHGLNEILIREALKNYRREELFISVKYGGLVGLNGMYYGIDVRPQAVENYLGYTLKRLGTDYVDLYQPCRINPNIPVEETIDAVGKLAKAGYVRHVGISEVDGETLLRANSVYPISLVEVEYSFLNRSIEDNLLPAARKLGIGVVAFNVLYNGLIGGRNPQEKIKFFQRIMEPAIFEKLNTNYGRFKELEALADEKGITLAQLAIAWVLAQGNDLMALIGCKTPEQMENTVDSARIELTAEEQKRIEQIIPKANANCSYMLNMDIDSNGLFKKG